MKKMIMIKVSIRLFIGRLAWSNKDFFESMAGRPPISSGWDIMKTFMGNGRDVAMAMFSGNGAQAAKLTDMLDLDGPLGPLLYISAIASTFLPLFSLIVTTLFIKSFSRLFGAEVDFSGLVKIL